MGQQRRYAERAARQMDDRIVQMIARGLEPDTLTEEQLQLDQLDLTRPPLARPMKAWVRYGEISVEVDVEVTAWTSRAAAIRWRVKPDQVHRAWVWAGAVSPRSQPT